MLVVANLLRYMCAKNYWNRAWFDKVIAKIKWCSFFTHMVHVRKSTQPGAHELWCSAGMKCKVWWENVLLGIVRGQLSREMWRSPCRITSTSLYVQRLSLVTQTDSQLLTGYTISSANRDKNNTLTCTVIKCIRHQHLEQVTCCTLMPLLSTWAANGPWATSTLPASMKSMSSTKCAGGSASFTDLCSDVCTAAAAVTNAISNESKGTVTILTSEQFRNDFCQ